LFDMVNVHCGREAILKIDIENFYPSIFNKRIYSLLLNMSCSPEIAQYLSELMTYKDKLPQGFSTSPMLSNIVSYNLDLEQIKICKKFDIVRTRWIDDMVFSGRRKDLEFAAPKLITSVKKNGFRINKEKLKFSSRRDKVEIVGLLANKHKPYISEIVVTRILSYIDIVKTEGYEKLIKAYPEEFGDKDIKSSLSGKIKHIQRFNKNQFNYFENVLREIP